MWGQAMVAHTFNPSTWEAEAAGFLNSRPAWSTKWVPEQPGLNRETLSWKKKVTNKQTKNNKKTKTKTIFKKYIKTKMNKETKTQVTADAGEDVQKKEHSAIAGGIASWYNHSVNQCSSLSENWT